MQSKNWQELEKQGAFVSHDQGQTANEEYDTEFLMEQLQKAEGEVQEDIRASNIRKRIYR